MVVVVVVVFLMHYGRITLAFIAVHGGGFGFRRFCCCFGTRKFVSFDAKFSSVDHVKANGLRLDVFSRDFLLSRIDDHLNRVCRGCYLR